MSRFRQLSRSRFEKGGSRVTFWRPKLHMSRITLFTW